MRSQDMISIHFVSSVHSYWWLNNHKYLFFLLALKPKNFHLASLRIRIFPSSVVLHFMKHKLKTVHNFHYFLQKYPLSSLLILKMMLLFLHSLRNCWEKSHSNDCSVRTNVVVPSSWNHVPFLWHLSFWKHLARTLL